MKNSKRGETYALLKTQHTAIYLDLKMRYSATNSSVRIKSVAKGPCFPYYVFHSYLARSTLVFILVPSIPSFYNGSN